MDLTYYINRFFSIGSKSVVRHRQRELLERLLGVEKQTLTAVQQIRVLNNIGLKSGRATLAKGSHTITFDEPMITPYIAILTGQTSTGAAVAITSIDDSNLNYFSFKIPIDCTVRWHTKIITQ